MKYISLKNDFGVDRAANPTAPSDQEITLSWINVALALGYKAGLTSDKRRIYSNILAVMDEAKLSKSDYLTLDPISYSFLKQAFEIAVIPPEQVNVITLTENAINNALDEMPVVAPVEPAAPVEPTPETPANPTTDGNTL